MTFHDKMTENGHFDPEMALFGPLEGPKNGPKMAILGDPPETQKSTGVGGSTSPSKIAKKIMGFLRRWTANGTWPKPVPRAKKGVLEGGSGPDPLSRGPAKSHLRAKNGDFDPKTALFSLWSDFFNF